MNDCAEIKLLAERKAGEMLRDMEMNKGTRLGGNIVQPPGDEPTLSEIGVSKSQSSRWQAVASVPSQPDALRPG